MLTGLNAVQTPSRLNRIRPLKDSTFVLDFRNDAEDITKAFAPYYGRTVAPPTDPNLLWDTRQRLDHYDVLRIEEIEATVELLVSFAGAKDHGLVYASLDPAVERFKAMDEEDRLGFKDALDKFVRTYSFLSQIVAFGDSELERDYRYCRSLAAVLRDQGTTEKLDLGSEVELSHLRSEMTFEGSLSLDGGDGEVSTVFGEGRGSQQNHEPEALSQIIDELNERFGLDLNERDQLFFDQIEGDWLAAPDLTAQARDNSVENFRLVFDRSFVDTVARRVMDNEDIARRFFDDEEC